MLPTASMYRSVSISILIEVADIASAGLQGHAFSVKRIDTAFDTGAIMLVLALPVVLSTIVAADRVSRTTAPWAPPAPLERMKARELGRTGLDVSAFGFG